MDLTEILLDIAKQGPLVGLLLWLYVDGRKRETENMARIDALQKELRDNQEKYLNKSFDQQAQTNAILAALKDAFKG